MCLLVKVPFYTYYVNQYFSIKYLFCFIFPDGIHHFPPITHTLYPLVNPISVFIPFRSLIQYRKIGQIAEQFDRESDGISSVFLLQSHELEQDLQIQGRIHHTGGRG